MRLGEKYNYTLLGALTAGLLGVELRLPRDRIAQTDWAFEHNTPLFRHDLQKQSRFAADKHQQVALQK